MKIFCDLDCTLNNSFERIKRNTLDKACNWKKAYSYNELMKDKPSNEGREFLNYVIKKHPVYILTARPFQHAKEITLEWLSINKFDFTELIVVRKPKDKISFLSSNDFLIDDFSRDHEIYEPYVSLDWHLIRELNKKNKKYFIFDGCWESVKKVYDLSFNE